MKVSRKVRTGMEGRSVQGRVREEEPFRGGPGSQGDMGYDMTNRTT